jgi:ketosteroid isomerase-like protein
MSEENVAVVRQAIAAVNDRDVDAYLALCTPDVEIVTPVAPIERNVPGPEGVRLFFSGLAEATSVFRLEIEELRPVGTNRVVALLRLEFESQRGVSLPQALGNVYELVEGKLRRVRVYANRTDALEAAGLRE